ncbi:ComEA family DNA-binding protein [Nocardioides campestrisoli]|uniref:ComEA family DNA-binding protein n=1 Tax=Nocardioides campestrisoli TaxID=2736757 RepID=UPI001C629112|nr:ComEA family DNA-binding protein [Nocardioides campestrisoli]
MRSRRPHPEHEQAVARRLALLSAELASVRAEHEVPAAPGTEDRTGDGPGEPVAVSDSGAWPWDEYTRVRSAATHPGADPGSQPGVDLGPDLAVDGAAGSQWGAGPGTGVAPARPGLVLPVPGRHAARRGLGRGLLLPGLRGSVALRPAHLTVVAVLAVVALGWTTWWVVSGEPESTVLPVPAGDTSPVAAPSTTASTAQAPGPGSPGTGVPSAQAGPAGAASGASGGGPAAEVVVDVAGKVRRPGLAVLPVGSRVADALAAVGGARPGVDLTSLNLARVLVDGEQLLVGVDVAAGPAGPVGSAPAGGPAPSPGGLVNLNTADEALLDTLPGVGPVTAAAIVAWRSEHGGFSAVDQLLDVNGIGEVTLAELTPLVTV